GPRVRTTVGVFPGPSLAISVTIRSSHDAEDPTFDGGGALICRLKNGVQEAGKAAAEIGLAQPGCNRVRWRSRLSAKSKRKRSRERWDHPSLGWIHEARERLYRE